jgi:hypothetical protein
VQNRRYRVFGTTVRGDDPNNTPMGVLRLVDLTELYQVRDEYIRSRPVVSIILVDNYEELTKNLGDGAISALDAKINDSITKWAEPYHGLLRRLEKNRFLFVFEKRDMSQAEEDKFSILEDIHQVTSNGLAVSLSMGMGVDGVNFEECYSFAALSIEMALSRGGDQAVGVGNEMIFFHGGSENADSLLAAVHIKIDDHQFLGGEAGNAGLGFVAVGLVGDIVRRVGIAREKNATAAGAGNQMLPDANLLRLRYRHLHSADRAAAVGHRREHDMVLFVKAVVEREDLRVELLLKRIDGIVQGIEMASVTGLVMFIAGKDQLLELTHYVNLAFHCFSLYIF